MAKGKVEATSAEGTFKIGDVVKLRSGGPKMSVQERFGKTLGFESHDFGNVSSAESYRCQWFAGSKLEDGVFPVESLVKVEDDSVGPK